MIGAGSDFARSWAAGEINPSDILALAAFGSGETSRSLTFRYYYTLAARCALDER
jgi:hypothetical protein